MENIKRKGCLQIILRHLRTAVLIDLSIFVVVGLIGLLVGWRTPYQYGGGLTWAGLIVILVAFLTGVGGIYARVDDIVGYSLTGAGDMSKHVK